ncbi:MAG: PKD domain-containing protein, partial [Actinobacteria bacterium]|nr:PKD domain-containing protein [Actinomycetota bacterium]
MKTFRVASLCFLATLGLVAAACAPVTPGGGGSNNLAPVPVLTATPTSGDYPLVVDFSSAGSTDPDGSIATYSWNFGDGSPLVSTADAIHTYTTAGSFTAKLTVYDTANKSSSATTLITTTTPPANVAPTASASATPSVGKVPLLVNFSSADSTDTDGTIASYSWDFGDGTAASTAADPTHTYTAAGSFTATLTITDDDGATDTADVAVQVNANVGPTAAANSNVTGGQVPLTILFSSAGSTDPDGGITSYSWDFGDGNGSTTANPTYSYSIPGAYVATLTVADIEGETDSASINITADAIPNVAPTAVAVATPSTVRQGLAVSFSSAGSADSDGTIASYNWDFGDGGTSSIANPTHAYLLAGPFVATLTVTDNAGGVANATTTVTVTPNLAPTAAAAGTPSSGKQPLLVSFSSTGSSDPDGT